MAHNPHPHGEKVVGVHQLKDHLSSKPGKVASLPDNNRETHKHEKMYTTNPPSAEPVSGHNPYHGDGAEPEE